MTSARLLDEAREIVAATDDIAREALLAAITGTPANVKGFAPRQCMSQIIPGIKPTPIKLDGFLSDDTNRPSFDPASWNSISCNVARPMANATILTLNPVIGAIIGVCYK